MSCPYQELCDSQLFYENRVFKYNVIYDNILCASVCVCLCVYVCVVSVGTRTFTSTRSSALALTYLSVSSL